ncbi:MAG: HTTM domain-containing protein [Gemmataceae bacterium]
MPFREIFALDVRSLAVFRLGLAMMVFLDWIDRIPDLRVFYSDAGVMPRSLITGTHPISIHMLSGATWVQAVLALIACVFAGMLFVGYRTVFATLVSWFLLISVHGRTPPLMQGGDQLLRMLLFWSMFLPLGACYSVDAARSADRPPSRSLLSLATVAYLLQICQVYWYAAGYKWMAPWREEGTAIYLALHVDYFPTRVGLWLREYPQLCRVLTHYTIWLETLGPVLLLLPFHVGLQRLVTIALFIHFHASLSLTMELGHFPFVCMVAWVALLPTSFWDRLQARFRDPAVAGLRVLYDGERPRAATVAACLRTFLLLGQSRLLDAREEPERLARLRKEGGWGVVDANGQESTGLDALRVLLTHSPVFAPLARTLGWPVVRPVLTWLLAHSGGKARLTPSPSRPAAWLPPQGWLANAIVLFCMVYVAIFNAVAYAGLKLTALYPETAAKWVPVVPNQFGQFGSVLGLEQGWGLFAPQPGRMHGWYLVVGVKADRSQIDLRRDGAPIDWDRPAFQTITYSNGRWRKLIMNLSAVLAYPYLLPGFTRHFYEEWNAHHEGADRVDAVEVYWMREFTVPPDEERPPVEKVFLGRYRPQEPRPGESAGWVLAVGTRKDGTQIDLLRGGMKIDWQNPDPEAAARVISPWLPVLLTLMSSDASSYMLPGFARYQLEEWNRQHQGAEQVTAVEVVWVKGANVAVGQPIPAADRKAVARYPEAK